MGREAICMCTNYDMHMPLHTDKSTGASRQQHLYISPLAFCDASVRTPGSHAREGARERKGEGARVHKKESERKQERTRARQSARKRKKRKRKRVRVGVGAGVGVGCGVCVRVWVILHSSSGRTKYIKRQGYCIFASVIYPGIGPSIFTT
jgi:hypothetical protein